MTSLRSQSSLNRTLSVMSMTMTMMVHFVLSERAKPRVVPLDWDVANIRRFDVDKDEWRGTSYLERTQREDRGERRWEEEKEEEGVGCLVIYVESNRMVSSGWWQPWRSFELDIFPSEI
ncbi:hypothetical protein Trydic_g15442 [Trypoxylus dichotomus]